MGDKVLSEAYKGADVPPGSSKLSVNQVNGTDVIELVVESSTPTYAERLAKELPNTYDGYVTGNRKSEITNAYTFAKTRLNEENEKLVEAEVALENFKVHEHITDAVLDRDRRMSLVQKAESDLQMAQTAIFNDDALLARLRDD